MKTTPTTFVTILPNRLCRAFAKLWRAGALALALIGGASTATAENHAVLPTTPPTVVGGSTGFTTSVAVDPSYPGYHFVYTVNPSDQVQVSFLSNNTWYTFDLTTIAAPAQPLEPVLSGTLLYADTGYHYLYYVGADFHLWVWFFNGSAWLNARLSNTAIATDLVGVDSSLHWLWYRYNGNLYVLYFDGSAWTSAAMGVADYDGVNGAVVDDGSHAVYWNDNTALSLRGCFFTGRAFVTQTLDPDANPLSRPAVHQGTGEIYSDHGSTARLFREVPNFTFGPQDVGVTSPIFDTNAGVASIAVNPVNGKVIYNTNANGSPPGIAVLSPNVSGGITTWTRSFVPGTDGQFVNFCAIDSVAGWYFYTTPDNNLHIVF